jgi:hypothetical protein
MEKQTLDGHFLCGGELAQTVQFWRKEAIRKVGNLTGIESEDVGRLHRSTLGQTIAPCALQKVKSVPWEQ